MKVQNLAIIFIVIILPLLMILGYYLNLQRETLQLQSEYNTKLSSSVKEGIKAYEINTVNWREVQGEERRNVTASVNTFLTSLANNMGVAGTSKEYISNYVPAVAMTMYDGYYIYSPSYVSQTIENDQGIQLYYNGTIVTTDATTDGTMNDVLYEPSASATNRKTAWYYYTDENGNDQKKSYTFVTDATQAAKTYEHTLSNKIAYSGTYTAKGGTIDVTINYTLDNRIYIYGRDNTQNKDINEQGCLVYFDSNAVLPRISLKANPQDEEDITVINPVNTTKYFGTNINSEILTEQILYKENSTSTEQLGTFKYIYDITGTKLYYDEDEESFFTLNSTTREKMMLPDSSSIRAGSDECRYKSVSVLTSDSTYKKLYQVLNGRDKGKWYISLKEDPDRITEVGPGVEVIDTELKIKRQDFEFTAIYRDYSAVSYYVEAYAFTNWMRDRLGGTVAQTRVVFDEDTNTYKQESITLNNIFNIGYVDPETGIINDLETEFSLISEHKKEVMIDTINSNLNLSISNYAQNTAGEYRFPRLKENDWDQIFTNISMIAFFQGVPIGLKTYNNYAIATSTLNRDYVDPDELYFISQSTSYHRPYCTQLTLANIQESYKGYRSVEYTLRTYSTDTGDIYYYQHTNQPTTTDNSDLGCYYCIVNKANYTKTINITSPTVEQTKISDIQAKAYKESLARERYYQDVEIAEDLGIMIRYHENIPEKVQAAGIITGITNMPEEQEALPNVYTTISDKIPIATTNDPAIKLICTGWSTDPDAEVMTYEKGKSYLFTESVDLYGIWSISLSGLRWYEDFRPSISQIRRGEDTAGGSNIYMVGNGYNLGKGAIWATIDSPYLKITEFSFDFSVLCGHSFNAAGLMFNVRDTGNQLEGYLFSVNFRGQFTNGGSGSIYKFVYKKNDNSNYFNSLTLVQRLNVPISGSGRNARFSGHVAIKVTDTGYLFTSDFSPDIPITVDSMHPNTFGFFSEHMSHACGDIGSFTLTNVQVKVEFL